MTPIATHPEAAIERYRFNDFSLHQVRNRQEARVAAAMREVLPISTDFCGCRLCVEDVYAIALNGLPPHYVQSGSMVLKHQPPTDEQIRAAVEDALDKVRTRPNHPE
jgi:Late competence development protein ComFB